MRKLFLYGDEIYAMSQGLYINPRGWISSSHRWEMPKVLS